MRLPQYLLDSPFFIFSDLPELLRALDGSLSAQEVSDITRMADLGLPPISSRHVLATMFGVSTGLVRSFEYNPSKHYRSFTIPKGKLTRKIDAPRVALKVVQKWLSVQLSRSFNTSENVFGFVSGKSHIDAAKLHTGARWVYSTDIESFFQTTPQYLVCQSLESIGYSQSGAEIISKLCCYKGYLAQGAPSSPVLSNICFKDVDARLRLIASKFEARLSRYADDIVFSGVGEFPKDLKLEVESLFIDSVWKLSEHKSNVAIFPSRLKVHGLLVHGGAIRLTKGYRNKIRAYTHLLEKGLIKSEDILAVKGHINYAHYVNTKFK